jgi:hypothetical protein
MYERDPVPLLPDPVAVRTDRPYQGNGGIAPQGLDVVREN